LHVARPDLSNQALANAFIQAGIEAGYPYAEDVNGGQQEGFGPIDRTTRKGRRWSAARAYLYPAMARPNLTVVTGALALGIRLEGSRACGIDYAVGNRREYAEALREVILSGGAINSPQLLQLSGIGAPDHLSPLGIAVRHELHGGGENLNDHPDSVIQHRCKQKVSLYPVTKGVRKIMTGLRWFMDQKGAAATNHFEAGAFIRSRAGIEHPDLQLTFMPLAVIPGSVDNVPD